MKNKEDEVVSVWNRRPDMWIPVSDRLPPNYKPVLALNSRGEYGIAWYYCWWNSREEDYQFDVSKITHWMPLPEPPKEGRVDG